MENRMMDKERKTETRAFISPEAMLQHWQGHRRLTRKMIEIFPEDKLFTYSLGGMRPFSEFVIEMVRMGAPGIKGIVAGKWQNWEEVEKAFPSQRTKEELLAVWDGATEQINSLWPHITADRFLDVEKIFGQWEGPVYWSILYFIDNEIHHRGQGYVYLRSLGIEPPHFWER